MFSNVPLRTLVTRVWLACSHSPVHFASTLFLTPGRPLYALPLLGWIVTAQGLRAVLYLIMRAQTAATFSVLLVLCTPWSSLLKALRVAPVADRAGGGFGHDLSLHFSFAPQRA